MLFFIFPLFVTSPVGYYVDNKILVRLKKIGNFNVFDDRLEINERTFYFHEIKKIGISFYIGGSKSSFVKKENHCVKFIIKTDGRFETYIIKQLATDDKTIKIDELFEKLKYKNGKFYRKIFIV